MTRIAILGFGLIGASIALALREKRGACHVTAIDRTEVLGSGAVQRIADERVDEADIEARTRAFASSDLTVLAAPVSAIVDNVEIALRHAPVVTDCGSTKRAVIQRTRSAEHVGRLVPGHPLAGGPHGGAEHARADLFVGRTWVICPARSSSEAMSAVAELIADVGAVALEMDAGEHDRAVALTSHVPQLLASVLVVLSERRRAERLEGPGFQRMTRAAGANPAVWRDIFGTNADEIAAVLRDLGRELAEVADELEQQPPNLTRATELLDRARGARRG